VPKIARIRANTRLRKRAPPRRQTPAFSPLVPASAMRPGRDCGIEQLRKFPGSRFDHAHHARGTASSTRGTQSTMVSSPIDSARSVPAPAEIRFWPAPPAELQAAAERTRSAERKNVLLAEIEIAARGIRCWPVDFASASRL
jgi:hypothetical protein